MHTGPTRTDGRPAGLGVERTDRLVDLLVVGAHLSGQPLNGELLDRGAVLVGVVRTAPAYRLWALTTEPPKPGLLRVASGGAAIVGERWRLRADAFGTFVAGLVAPMTIGPVELADGGRVPGFLVEPVAVAGALDITAYGGWEGYLAAAARDREHPERRSRPVRTV